MNDGVTLEKNQILFQCVDIAFVIIKEFKADPGPRGVEEVEIHPLLQFSVK